MLGQCFVELDGKEIIRIFRSPLVAKNSKAWAENRVKEMLHSDAVLAIRKAIFFRSNNQCENCGCFITWNSMHMDEKLSRGKGGEYSLENCRALCANCHILRKDSVHGGRNPRF